MRILNTETTENCFSFIGTTITVGIPHPENFRPLPNNRAVLVWNDPHWHGESFSECARLMRSWPIRIVKHEYFVPSAPFVKRFCSLGLFVPIEWIFERG